MSNEVELQLDEPSFDGFEDADLGDIFGVPNPKPAVSAIPPTLLNNDDNASTFNFLPDDNMSENMRTQRLKEQNGFESSLNSNIDGQQLAPLAKCKQEQIYNDNEFENGYNNNGNNNNNINNNQNINNNNNGIQASTDGTTNIAMHQAGYYDVPPDLLYDANGYATGYQNEIDDANLNGDINGSNNGNNGNILNDLKNGNFNGLAQFTPENEGLPTYENENYNYNYNYNYNNGEHNDGNMNNYNQARYNLPGNGAVENQLNEATAEQLLKELKKEEEFLNEIMFELTGELEKTEAYGQQLQAMLQNCTLETQSHGHSHSQSQSQYLVNQHDDDDDENNNAQTHMNNTSNLNFNNMDQKNSVSNSNTDIHNRNGLLHMFDDENDNRDEYIDGDDYLSGIIQQTMQEDNNNNNSNMNNNSNNENWNGNIDANIRMKHEKTDNAFFDGNWANGSEHGNGNDNNNNDNGGYTGSFSDIQPAQEDAVQTTWNDEETDEDVK